MTPMLATLEVVGTLLWLLICILANRWYLWALLAVVVILDVVSARKKDREKEKRDAAATEALIREFRLDRSAPPANNGQTITNDQKPPEPPKEPAKKFKPPTVEDVRSYCKAKGYAIDAARFVSYYESNGWRVGKNAMKSWQAAVQGWAARDKKEGGGMWTQETDTGNYEGIF